MRQPLRAVIADDERLALQKLRVMLMREPGIEVVAECQDGAEALAALRAHGPNVLFLDIRMPQVDGLEVLERIADRRDLALVLTTAYDNYAVRAFEANAVDYLLKPFDAQRLHRAVEKVRGAAVRPPAKESEVGANLPSTRPQREGDSTERVIIKSSGRYIFLDLRDVDAIEAAANYVRLHVGSGSYLMRESIGKMAERLDPRAFVRIHRSTIVNRLRIQELKACDGGEYLVTLVTGKVFSCSRSYRRDLLDYARHSQLDSQIS